MLPDIWGPHAWKFIHYVASDYPINPTDQDKQNYYNFFSSLQYVLPCAKCRYNLKRHYQKYPLTEQALESRANLLKWTIDLHNVVNYYTGKPMLNEKEAMKKIDSWNNNHMYLYWIAFIIVIIIVIIFAIYYRKKFK